jgi:uncharacterized Zn finger protein
MGIDPLAVGTEVRLGRLHRENAPTKAMRLLVEGRVQVRSCGPEGVQAFVRGSGHLHRVEHRAGTPWSCTCAAHGRCSHIIAVQHVVIAPYDPRVPPGGHVA